MSSSSLRSRRPNGNGSFLLCLCEFESPGIFPTHAWPRPLEAREGVPIAIGTSPSEIATSLLRSRILILLDEILVPSNQKLCCCVAQDCRFRQDRSVGLESQSQACSSPKVVVRVVFLCDASKVEFVYRSLARHTYVSRRVQYWQTTTTPKRSQRLDPIQSKPRQADLIGSI